MFIRHLLRNYFFGRDVPSLSLNSYFSLEPHLCLDKTGLVVVSSPLNITPVTSDEILDACMFFRGFDPHQDISCRGLKNSIDSGMIDVTNPLQFIPFPSSPAFLLHFSDIVSHARAITDPIIAPLGHTFSHSSLYLYRNVLLPRCLHCDTLRKSQFKAFVLLSPVSLDDGPYSVIPLSQKAYLRKALSVLSNTIFGSDLGNHRYDMTLFSSNEALPVTGETGAVFITNQAAVHGDLPALTSGAIKASLVLNYL
jgi:hypothetical protein